MMDCKHCGHQVVEFSFKTGREWWHFNPAGGLQHRGCLDSAGNLRGTLAEPRATANH
jgi:hypothetical protein